jgi:hypothetical protein
MTAAWVVTVGLTNWRNQINVRFPNRDKKSDGTIGDLSHQLESASGHNPDITGKAEWRDGDKLNEVRAWDMDSDLFDKFGYTAEKLVQYLVGLGRTGKYLPWRYLIYKRRIWRKATGWVTQTYNGPSPHDEHIHFSGDFSEKADNWNGDLGIATLGIPKEEEVEQADIDKIVRGVVNYMVDVDTTAKGVNKQPLWSVIAYGSSEHHQAIEAAKASQAAANAAAQKVASLAVQLDATLQNLAEVKALLVQLTKPTA